MSEWGDDDPQHPREHREPGRAFGLDLTELTAKLVKTTIEKTIRTQLTAAVSDQVQTAVTDALAENTLAELRVHAETATADALAQQRAAIDDKGEAEDPAPATEQPPLYYGSVDEFVRDYLINAYRRRIDGQNRVWAAHWWNYDEAVIRLEALWRSWEHLRRDPATGMSLWWRDHADHHMAVLMSPDGPFAGLTETGENRNKKGQPLPYAAPPPGLFPDVRVPDRVPDEKKPPAQN